MTDYMNGHAAKSDGVSFHGWTKDERTLFLQTIGRYVEDRIKLATAPLLKRLEELEARKFCGVHQRAQSYKAGSQVTHDGALWICIEDAAPNECPGSSLKWQLGVKAVGRQPTKHGELRPHPPVERRP